MMYSRAFSSCSVLALLVLPGLITAQQFKQCDWPDLHAALQRFSRILTFRTESTSSTANHARDTEEFHHLDAFLQEAYPLVWQHLKVEKVGVDDLSYLITWPGTQPSLRPVLFISHIDVVPVPEESLKDWTYPPFSGAIALGYVWGRGAMDVKVTVVALLEAATALLKDGWAPQRTLLFAFGQDEEVGGATGAAKTAELLRQRGVELEVIWDEGTSILSDGFPPLTRKPFALVATAEKGYQSVQIHVNSTGGHSSMPPVDGSSVGAVLGRILTALDRSPPPAVLKSPITEFVKGLASSVPGWLAPVLAACDLPGFRTLVAKLLAAAGSETAALVRMTAAPTRISAGVADNVLPQQGVINVNLRLLPGQDAETALSYLRGLIGTRDLPRVELVLASANGSSVPSSVTDAAGPHFALLKRAIQEVWRWGPGEEPVDVLPFLLPGGTDSKHYRSASAHGVVRFVPYASSAADIKRVHGTDERQSVEGYSCMLRTYHKALQLLGGLGEAAAHASHLGAATHDTEL